LLSLSSVHLLYDLLQSQDLSTIRILIHYVIFNLNTNHLANFLSIMLDFKPSYIRRAGCLPQKSSKDLDRGALSITIRSKKSKELAIINLEGYSFDSLSAVSVRLYKILDLNCWQLSNSLSY